MLIRTRVAARPIHGLGLFAAEPTPKGTPIWRFAREFDLDFLPTKIALLPAPAREHLRWFGFVRTEDGHVVISGDHSCFMNHCMRPNTGAASDAEAPIITVALRDIAVGEELTCDYASFDADAHWKLGTSPSLA